MPPMQESEQGPETARKRAGACKLPLFLALLLWCAVAICVWLLWARFSHMADMSATSASRLEALRNQRDALVNIAALPPCEAKAALSKMTLEK